MVAGVELLAQAIDSVIMRVQVNPRLSPTWAVLLPCSGGSVSVQALSRWPGHVIYLSVSEPYPYTVLYVFAVLLDLNLNFKYGSGSNFTKALILKKSLWKTLVKFLFSLNED